VNEALNHPTIERLQDFVEASLDEALRSSVDAHLAGCQRCRTEVEEYRALFGALESLPELAPSVGFADRVMSGVRVRRPVRVLAGAWAARLTPQTTRGWAAAAALFALPLLGASLLTWWLMSQPGVTPQGLWLVVTALGADALGLVRQWSGQQLAGIAQLAWVSWAAETLRTVGRGEIGLALVMFATATAGSAYVLYLNLFRPQARRAEHASYVF
jgi:anti-sigma factor RsiW